MWALSGEHFQGGRHHLHHQHHCHHHALHLYNNHLHHHDSEKGGEDKSRVGASENTLLGSSDLSTIIGPGTGKVVEENITIITTYHLYHHHHHHVHHPWPINNCEGKL